MMKGKKHISFIVILMLVPLTVCIDLEAAEKTITSPTIGAHFVLIPVGSYMMGNSIQHQVVISKPFYMQTTEVTQGQWQKIMGDNPSIFRNCGSDCPVENVSWLDALQFIGKLNQMEKTDKYRLPTEAEWEYASRAGSAMKFSFGNSEDTIGDYAWYDKNSGRRTHPVAQRKANTWGLYDMYGNVSEWCQDWQDDYPTSTVTDPKGPSSGQHRILRGGSWLSNAVVLTSAFRGQDYPMVRSNDIGFRLVKDF
ncbi:MAG: formylglycine-generating enzyme family protein [Syntrophaceae bacterium]